MSLFILPLKIADRLQFTRAAAAGRHFQNLSMPHVFPTPPGTRGGLAG
ncbi:hypothetical protein GRZ55_13365 [Chelativorans sp. ZYF759]|nr:hypothetical protein [Chelativorans sp. ZYF759]NMG40232.1 hypothetical protein [Chelativorans sp. ZYF759]